MDDRYILLMQTGDPAAIPLVQSVLDGAEIPFLLQGNEAGALFPMAASPLSAMSRGLQVRVLVPESRAEEARELLAADFSAEFPDDADDPGSAEPS